MIIIIFSLLLLLYTFPASHAYSTPNRRCTYGEPCWPSSRDWDHFNATISGRLIASLPPASACHDPHYSQSLCATAKTEWGNSFWRTAQPGAYAGLLFESDQCAIDTPKTKACEPGLVPHYSVNASGVEDIQKAVRWADRKKLHLAVKNTGHDHLGRSSGKGAFAIWTHNLKGREWHDLFVTKGAPAGSGVPAVTLQAGEQWLDVYRDAAVHNRIVVGGSARTVGAAGGYLTGGGHSAFSHFYGLAVDNLLEATLVTPSGAYTTLNAYTDAEHFWALRGGGGSTWGVITSATYRTHPPVSHIQVALVSLNITSQADGHRDILHHVLPTLPNITAAGYTGYSTLANGFAAIFVKPNGTGNETFAPLTAYAATLPPGSAAVTTFDFPDWISYCNVFLSDPNVATNNIDSSRLLLPADVTTPDTLEALIDLIVSNPDAGAGFNFLGQVATQERANTAVHPDWARSFGVFSLGTDGDKARAVQFSRVMAGILGGDRGTYANEANPWEPEWERVFWGKNYAKLLTIRKRVDPRGVLGGCNRCVGGVVWDF
ncbi:FAD/FMN-containing protein [Geopyxis carbonaria]|nr:FAD/FMN-containing protein [Geopyxis carbonaria]